MIRLSLSIAMALGLSAALTVTPATAQFEVQSEQSFRAADLDGNELLTLSEFRTFIQLMADAGAPMSQRIVNLAAYRVAFRRVDTNGDGLATPNELRAAERAN